MQKSPPKKRSAQPPAMPALKKRIAAARAFKSVEDRGPQGYTYIFIGRSRKISRSEVRSRLRSSGIDTGRIIDVSFPVPGAIGLLVHVQYKDELIRLMTEAGATVRTEMNLFLPEYLADPQYNGLSAIEREAKLYTLHQQRCHQVLEYIRPVLVRSVGRYFTEAGWLSEEDVAACVDAAAKRLAKENPRRAAFSFRNVSLEQPVDDLMEDSDSVSGVATQ